MQKDIAVLSYHTRFDSAIGGVNDTAAELLGLSEVVPFGGENGQCGRIGSLPEPLAPQEFAAVLKEIFGSTSVRASLFKTPVGKSAAPPLSAEQARVSFTTRMPPVRTLLLRVKLPTIRFLTAKNSICAYLTSVTTSRKIRSADE